MSDTPKNKVCWYKNGMNKYFSSKGYIHFCAKVPMDEDFEEGTPYTFNEVEKTFGKADLVYDAEDAKRITEKLVAEIQANTERTAEQRAEACLRTIGKWEGGEV